MGQVDVEGLNLTISPGEQLAGRLVWDGPPEANSVSFQIFLQSVDLPMAGGHATAAADGSFVINNIADGEARVFVGGMGKNSFIKSVRYGTSESTSREVNITPGVNASLEVTLSSRGGAHYRNRDRLRRSASIVGLGRTRPRCRKSKQLLALRIREYRSERKFRIPGNCSGPI